MSSEQTVPPVLPVKAMTKRRKKQPAKKQGKNMMLTFDRPAMGTRNKKNDPTSPARGTRSKRKLSF